MAALAVSIIGIVEAGIPGFIALWNAITNLRSKNPALTPEQVLAMVQAMEATIVTLDNDTLQTLALIAPLIVKATPQQAQTKGI